MTSTRTAVKLCCLFVRVHDVVVELIVVCEAMCAATPALRDGILVMRTLPSLAHAKRSPALEQHVISLWERGYDAFLHESALLCFVAVQVLKRAEESGWGVIATTVRIWLEELWWRVKAFFIAVPEMLPIWQALGLRGATSCL